VRKITKLKNLAITCGGTGGHFLPGLTIAREFNGGYNKVLMILGGKNIESQAETAEGFSLNVSKLKPMPAPKGIISFFRFIYGSIWGTIASIKAMREFRPDALLAMGSFASMPPVLAAKILGIPLFLHDGNARVGKANRFFSKWARLMGLAYPPVNTSRIQCPYECIGVPIRPELDYQPIEKTKAIEKINTLFDLKFKANLPTLLIFGGSQGAQIFNETFPQMMMESGRTDFQVLHLTGEGKFDSVKAAYEKAKFPVLCLAGTSGMHWFYQAADAVICRSGGSTIAELCIFGKFAFLIPYPFASEKHQDDNAHVLVDIGAAEMLDNSECSTEKTNDLLTRWLADPADFIERGKWATEFAKPCAADDMIWLIERMI
jgi:UDP-N-acetylglucosamine--N-acetylmuramyl-(pentapeptide) pyrophosphoryl-undecaprenol N-acetylglucosamine transferase